MADNSYAELLTGKVELNLSDFQAKMAGADAALDALADGPDIHREGSEDGFSQAGAAMIDAAIDQMEDFVTSVMAEANVQVPEDTGVLKRSARPLVLSNFRIPTAEELGGVGVPVQEGNRIIVEFGYGYGDEINPKTKRIAAQYALPVHEIYHAEHEPPTKSHYLVDPLIDKASEFGPELAASMRGAALAGLRINKGVFLFRKGGGPGINPVVGPTGIIKRRT